MKGVFDTRCPYDRKLNRHVTSHRKQSSKKRPPMYKVLLHNDNNNRREYVVKVLLKVVDGLTMDDAINVMNVRMRGQWHVICVCRTQGDPG